MPVIRLHIFSTSYIFSLNKVPALCYHIIPWIQNFRELVNFCKQFGVLRPVNHYGYIRAIPWTTAKEYYKQYTTTYHISNKCYLNFY